jgi:quinol monooxygenase YgiN
MNIHQIQVTATFPAIAREDLTEFKQAVSDAIARTENESGTLQYDWFSNDDETKWVVRETYENSDANLTHIDNCGDCVLNF